MKNREESRNVKEAGVSRRKFIGQTAAAALGFTIVPRRVLGGVGYVPPSDKVNIAFIGVGAQGLRVMLHFLKEPDVQGVAVCDCNKSGANYPQWGNYEFRDSVRKLLGVDSGWEWLSPDQPLELTHALHVTSGVAGREPCQKIVDGYNGRKSALADLAAARLTTISENCWRSRRIWTRWWCARRTICTRRYPLRHEEGQTCVLPEASDAHAL